jgi:hypothetical protein
MPILRPHAATLYESHHIGGYGGYQKSRNVEIVLLDRLCALAQSRLITILAYIYHGIRAMGLNITG